MRLLLDGAHLVHDAHDAGLAFEIAAVAASRLQSDTEEARIAHALVAAGHNVVVADDQVFRAMSPVRTPSGIVAIVSREPVTASDICARANAFVLAGVDVQDPGNVGSLIRAGEAAGATGALLCGSSAHPFSWKAVRGSMGSALRLPVAGSLDVADAETAMKAAGLRTIAAVPRGGRDPDAIDWTGPIALWVGGEGPGLTDAIIAASDERVTIPMAAPVESLNVAVAGAVLVYAARRQRS